MVQDRPSRSRRCRCAEPHSVSPRSRPHHRGALLRGHRRRARRAAPSPSSMRRASSYERIAVPGALEIPQVLAQAPSAGSSRAAPRRPLGRRVALGCVIRGETSHYDIVCNNANHWLMEVAIRHSVPVGNGILTVDTEAQAMARARGGARRQRRRRRPRLPGLIEIVRAFRGTGAHDRSKKHELRRPRKAYAAHRGARRRRAGALPDGHGRHRPQRGDRRVRAPAVPAKPPGDEVAAGADPVFFPDCCAASCAVSATSIRSSISSSPRVGGSSASTRSCARSCAPASSN